MSLEPVAATPSGPVRGAQRDGIITFLGIPYARAERFAAPAPPPAWATPRDAVDPGPVCPQPSRPVAQFTHGARPPMDEDCLNLNVWTPSLEGRRPVLVWIHGGGFAIGHGSASLYDGAALAAAGDLVVVTLNYRLGSFGWLAHPGLGDRAGGAQGNWGLQDQLAALRWVAAAIDNFGGDPAQVTLAGQSAGALSAMGLLVHPAADGLFHRAILQSPPLGDVAQAPERGTAWAEALSAMISPAPGFDHEALRAASAERLVALHEQLLESEIYRGTRGGALPTLDPATLPVSPREVPGARPDVDVLIGSTADEGSFFFGSPWRPAPPAERMSAIAGHLTGEPGPVALARAAAAAEAQGADGSALALLRRIGTEALIAGPLRAWAQARRAAVGGRSGVWRYRVDHPGAGPDLGATHTAEVPLIFGTWHDGDAGERLGGQPVAPGLAPTPAVAGALQAAWIGFIRAGDPGWDPQHSTVFGGADVQYLMTPPSD